MTQVLTVDAILFGILVLSGILGNFLVISVVLPVDVSRCFSLSNVNVLQVLQSSLESSTRYISPSNVILVNLSLANLLTTLFRTLPIFVSDLGLNISLEDGACRLFMLLWVWWRSVGCWTTLGLSVFHCITLRRKQVAMCPFAQQRERRRVLTAVGLVWGVNFALSLPALVYTKHVEGNVTVEVMVISCTTRPLLGCTWEFPSGAQAVAFASASLAINEITPLLLMVGTNMITLHALGKHIRSIMASGQMKLENHGATERKAGQVIMALVTLFVVCWVMQVAAVTYYNHNGGEHKEALLTVSHFSASLFTGFSPLVVAMGHNNLRRKIHSMLFGRFSRETTLQGTEREDNVSSTQTSKVKQ